MASRGWSGVDASNYCCERSVSIMVAISMLRQSNFRNALRPGEDPRRTLNLDTWSPSASLKGETATEEECTPSMQIVAGTRVLIL